MASIYQKMITFLRLQTAHLLMFCDFSKCRNTVRADAIPDRRRFILTIVLAPLVTTLLVFTSSNYDGIATPTTWNKPPVKPPTPKCDGCRSPEDGKWFVQTTPFPINMYSAFYDNRTSLETNTSQIVLIGQFNSGSIDRCGLWFADDPNSKTVPAKIVGLVENDKLLICALPGNIPAGQIPVEVAPVWSDKSTPSILYRTAFRLPVEVPRWTTNRGNLALCLTAMNGGDWQPQQIVEWLEMQRLLGVERVIVYNRSMPYQLRRVFNEYSDDAVEDDPKKIFVVELRQSHGSLPSFVEGYSHQTPTLNDCFYRNMGSFRYIAVIDADELIVPRQNFTTIPELIDHLTADSGLTIGSFVFRDVHYFNEGHANDTEEEIYRLIPASYRNYSTLPSYLTKRRRAVVPSPLDYYVKSVINSEACLGVWVHVCNVFTSRYALRNKTEQLFQVEPELAHKHHNRKGCTFDMWKAFFKMDSCQRALQTSIVDDVLIKYSNQLLVRLLKQNEKLKGI